MLLIGEEETLSYGELAERIGRLIHGEDWRTLALPRALQKPGAWNADEVPRPGLGDQAVDGRELGRSLRIDISRARNKLGWEPRHS